MRKKRDNLPLMEVGRVPPQAVDLEESLIGAILYVPKLLTDDLRKHFLASYFYKESHQIIVKAINILADKNTIPDLIAVTTQLKKTNKLKEVGGAYYLTVLSNRASTYNLIENMLIIRQMYIYRELIRISSETIKTSYNMARDVFDLIPETSDKVLALTPDVEEEKDTKLAVNDAIQDIFLRAEGKKKSIWEIGYEQFDRKVGISPGFFVTGGAIKTGKTTFWTFIFSRLLKKHKDVAIHWVSIDHEDRKSIMRKFFSQSLHLTENQLIGKEGTVPQAKLDQLIALQDFYKAYDIEFEEKTNTIENLCKGFNKFVKKRPKNILKVFFLDNLVKVRKPNGSRDSNKASEYIATYLQDFYNSIREENVLFVIVHHFGKAQKSPEKAKDGYRPITEDLRDSGVLTAVADKVILINRPGKYPEIQDMYKHDFLPNFTIVEVTESTFGEEGLMYFWSHLAYSIYDEIKELNT